MNPRRARRRTRSADHRFRARIAVAIGLAVRDVIPDMAAVGMRYPKAHVNNGWCMDVAEGARVRLRQMGITALVVTDDDELCWSDHEIYMDGGWTHQWIWVSGRHHDAEAPMGVRRWLDLPHFRRWTTDRGDPLTDGVVIVPVLAQGDEVEKLHRSARFMRAVQAEIEEHVA